MFSEAARVWEFKRVCDEGADDASGKLSDLMNASHDSCSRLYECSCEELDKPCPVVQVKHCILNRVEKIT